MSACPHRHRRPAQLATTAATVVAVVIAGCGGASRSASRSSAATRRARPASGATLTESLATAAARARAQLRGVPQHGLVIGRSGAGVVIVEYGDIDCSVCAAVHEGVVPELIARYVASGRATLELRPVATSVRSGALARGAYAAGRQGRGWDFVQLAYRRARAGSGAAAEAPAALAAALGLNVSRWRADLHRRQWQLDLRAAREVASVAGFGSYPVFLVRAAGSSGSTSQPAPYTVLGPRQTIAQLRRAIARASAGRH